MRISNHVFDDNAFDLTFKQRWILPLLWIFFRWKQGQVQSVCHHHNANPFLID
jgi:hypothetical protein